MFNSSFINKKMEEKDFDFNFKVLLLGNSGVGKSSLLLRFVDMTFNETFISTLGVDFKVKTMEIEDKNVKMQIWDTAGQERFRNIISSYFKGCHGILLLYDITNKESFKNLGYWLHEIEANANQKVLKILIGNKNDLEEERQISVKEGQDFADKKEMQFIETSVKMNNNINEAFYALGKKMIEYYSKQKPTTIQDNNEKKTLVVKAGKDLNTKKGCCN